MGRIIKYNVAKGEDGERIKSVVFGSASSGYPTIDNTKEPDNKEMSVNLWGNNFHGIEDLQGTITVTNGDIFIKFDEEDFDPTDYEDDEIVPSGSLYVDGKIQAPTGNITTINSTTANIETIYSTTINSTTGNIETIYSTTGEIETINANNITATGNITVSANIFTTNLTGTGRITGAILTANSRVVTPTLNADSINFNYPDSDSEKKNLLIVLETINEQIEENNNYIYEVDHKRLDLLEKVNLMQQHQTDQDTTIERNSYFIDEIQEQLVLIQNRLDEIEYNR